MLYSNATSPVTCTARQHHLLPVQQGNITCYLYSKATSPVTCRAMQHHLLHLVCVVCACMCMCVWCVCMCGVCACMCVWCVCARMCCVDLYGLVCVLLVLRFTTRTRRLSEIACVWSNLCMYVCYKCGAKPLGLQA